jgi:8-oxo-dGTP pyrophosphatase MutT (NUDIX family)
MSPILSVRGAADLSAAPGDLDRASAAVREALPGPHDHEDARRRILAFVARHPDALLRTCTEGHLTGSALVVDPATEQILLLFHAKVRRWLQPGGHADGDGDLAHVALREATEETGLEGLRVVTPAIDLDVHVFRDARGHDPDHLHLDVRHLVLTPPGSVVATNHESDGHAWVSELDLQHYEVDPGTVRMAAAGLALVRSHPELGRGSGLS